MYILPLDKISRVTEDYLVINDKQALADFELFQKMAKGDYLILDENTVNQSNIEKMIGRHIVSKSGSEGSASYLSYVQPEPQPELAGVSPSFFNEIPRGQETDRLKAEEWLRRGEEFKSPPAFSQWEEQSRRAEETITAREKSISLETASKSEELRRLKLDIEKEKETLRQLAVQREAAVAELQQVTNQMTQLREKAKMHEDKVNRLLEEAREAGNRQEETDIARLFMLQEERLKQVSQTQDDMFKQVSQTQDDMFKQVSQAQAENRNNNIFTGNAGSDVSWELKPAVNLNGGTNEARALSFDFGAPTPGPYYDSPPERNSAPMNAQSDLVQDYIDRQRGTLLGKTLGKNILDENGNLLLQAGTMITDKLFDEISVRRKDAVIEMAMFAE